MNIAECLLNLLFPSAKPISSSRQVWLVYDILSQASSTEARQIVDWLADKESYQANTFVVHSREDL